MKIGIVGLGLIGGTIAKALNKHHLISAYDISDKAIAYAIENKIIHKSYDKLDRFFAENDLIFICLYPKNIINFIFQNKLIIPNSSVIVEISGVKEHLINEVDKIRPFEFDLIFTHPVAGSEKTGVYNSDEKIFEGANFVITPVKSNKQENLKIVERLAEEMKFKNISYITPKEHDDIIGYTSQLTHILSISLVNALSTNLDTSRFIGDSYRDLTRISMINDMLWPDLFLMNKASILKQIDIFEKELASVKNAIKVNDRDELQRLMQQSTLIRRAIGGVKKDDS